MCLAKLTLSKKYRTLLASNAPMDAQSIVTLYTEESMFDSAFSFASLFAVPFDVILERICRRCLYHNTDEAVEYVLSLIFGLRNSYQAGSIVLMDRSAESTKLGLSGTGGC